MAVLQQVKTTSFCAIPASIRSGELKDESQFKYLIPVKRVGICMGFGCISLTAVVSSYSVHNSSVRLFMDFSRLSQKLNYIQIGKCYSRLWRSFLQVRSCGLATVLLPGECQSVFPSATGVPSLAVHAGESSSGSGTAWLAGVWLHGSSGMCRWHEQLLHTWPMWTLFWLCGHGSWNCCDCSW